MNSKILKKLVLTLMWNYGVKKMNFSKNKVKQICHSISDLRKNSNKKSELETQCLYGEKVHILDIKNNWSFVKTIADNYKGFIENNNFRRFV